MPLLVRECVQFSWGPLSNVLSTWKFGITARVRIYVNIGKSIHSNDPKIISTMMYQSEESEKEKRRNSMYSKCEGSNKVSLIDYWKNTEESWSRWFSTAHLEITADIRKISWKFALIPQIYLQNIGLAFSFHNTFQLFYKCFIWADWNLEH